MNRAINQLVAPIAAVFFAAVSGCMGRTPLSASVSTGSSPVDSVTAQLTDLELQRLARRAATSADTASTRDIDTQIAALHERLRSLRLPDNVERIAAERLLVALDGRDSSVTIRLQQARMAYTDRYPPVRQMLLEQELLRQRRNEIRAALSRQ